MTRHIKALERKQYRLSKSPLGRMVAIEVNGKKVYVPANSERAVAALKRP